MKSDAARSPSVFTKFCLLAVIVLGVFINYHVFTPLLGRNLAMTRQEINLKVKIDELSQENARLQDDIRNLSENPVFVEKVAREELGMGRPKELVYKFRNPQKN